MAFSFLTQELAMDLGTANTIIFQNDQIVLDEPSIVAVESSTGKCIALGHKVKLMHEREYPGIKTIRPLKDGVIADFNAAEMMIRGFIRQVNSKRRSFFSPSLKLVVGIPSGSTEVEIRAVRDSGQCLLDGMETCNATLHNQLRAIEIILETISSPPFGILSSLRENCNHGYAGNGINEFSDGCMKNCPATEIEELFRQFGPHTGTMPCGHRY